MATILVIKVTTVSSVVDMNAVKFGSVFDIWRRIKIEIRSSNAVIEKNICEDYLVFQYNVTQKM